MREEGGAEAAGAGAGEEDFEVAFEVRAGSEGEFEEGAGDGEEGGVAFAVGIGCEGDAAAGDFADENQSV